MHLYWRVIEELKYLEELWEITDPAISRHYKLWKEMHADTVNLVFGQAHASPENFRVFCQGTSSIH
jgi:hypothetical protein